MEYFAICDTKKNIGYGIIELISYCFIINLKFSFNELNAIVKYVSLTPYKNFVPIYSYLSIEGRRIVRACDHVNLLPNINTCENEWSYFSANMRVVALKLLELTQFASPNH